MTAINVLLQRDAGHLVTDAAWYDLDGYLLNLAPKSQAIGHWPGAIATRGPGLANAAIATEAGFTFADIDAFADGACQFLASWCDRNRDHLAGFEDQSHVEMLALGWSRRTGGPRAFHVSSRDDVALARERGLTLTSEYDHLNGAFELVEIEAGYVKPMPKPDALNFYGIDPGADFDALPSVETYGTGLICAQRELREPILPGDDPVCFVGGYVMLTTVTRDGVTMRKGASFPDEVGSRIQATRGDLIGSRWPATNVVRIPVAAMTRQQRRAAEAAERKRRSHAV